MPNIVFVSNNKAHWVNGVSSTTAGTFDSTRVPYAIELAEQEVMTSPVFTPVAGDDTWMHFRMFMDSIENNGFFTFFKAFDISGNLLFVMSKKVPSVAYTVTLTHYNGAGGSETAEQTIPFNRNRVNNVDIKVEMTGVLMAVHMYVNGGLAITNSIASNPASWGAPAYFTVGCAFSDLVTDTMNFSEFIVADVDTRNARMSLVRPTATGGEADWIGPAANLSDDDPASGITTTAANARHTLDLAAYGGASNISAVMVASQSLAGANGPQNMRHTVRMSAVNYDSTADILLGATLSYELTQFDINPATSLPWVGGDLATMEMGFISKA